MASATHKWTIVERGGVLDTDEDRKDESVKNHWKWAWLEKCVNGSRLAESIRKITKTGHAICVVCDKEIKYANRGRIALTEHVSKDSHLEIVKLRKKNTMLPGQKPPASASNNYGLHPMFSKVAAGTKNKQSEPSVSIKDRISTAEAKVLAFAAEKSMTFSDVPALIALSKSLAKDKAALDALKMDRTTASYKMTHGLCKTMKDELIEDLKNSFFSLNLDECTSKTNVKVVAVLACYFSVKEQKVVVKHLSSFSIIKCDSETLYNAIVNLFEELDLPWGNLVSVLMDSCNVMRGSKSGLETRIRSKAPHLLDIDGDSCHHAHNASKRFCKPFEKYVEMLMNNLYNDFKWSSDKKEALQIICDALGIKFTVPECYVPHRWLSVYDVSVDTERLLDAYQLFYFSFLSKEDSVTYRACIDKLYEKYDVPESTRAAIEKLHKQMGKKKMTADGEARTKRIVEKLFYTEKKTKVLLHIYITVLPILKKYVMLFQMSKPMIHLLNDKQIELFTDFLSLFMKPELLQNPSGAQLTKLKVDDVKNHLPESSIFLVRYINTHLKGANAKKVVTQLKAGYVKCGKCLQDKMPINNRLLKSVSVIDPKCLGNSEHLSTVQRYFLKLPTLITNVFPEGNENEKFDLEVRKFLTDSKSPASDDIVTWWTNVDRNNYPCLTRLVFAILSCFHGPEVESSFSIMQTVMNKTTNSIHVESLSAIQTIKYELKSSGKSALEYFERQDHIYDPVKTTLCRNMRLAYKQYNIQKETVKKKQENKLETLGIKKPSTVVSSKTKAKLQAFARAQSTVLAHQHKCPASPKKRKNPSETLSTLPKHPRRE